MYGSLPDSLTKEKENQTIKKKYIQNSLPTPLPSISASVLLLGTFGITSDICRRPLPYQLALVGMVLSVSDTFLRGA